MQTYIQWLWLVDDLILIAQTLGSTFVTFAAVYIAIT